MRTIKKLINTEKKVYILLKNKAIQYRFMSDAEREGITVRYVEPAYTSQTCARCGHIDKENRQTQERFICTKCGFELNADHNAAINIARSEDFSR